MINQALFIPLMALFLALSPQSASGQEDVETVVQEPQKTIEERSAGLHLRQPDEERAWMDMLPGALEASPEAAKMGKEVAEEAVIGAKAQESLVQTYKNNIWAKVKEEFEQNGLEYDEEYLGRLVFRNREQSLYESTHLYVFISESVPTVTLRNYQKALEGIPTAFILRGLIGDDPSKFRPTQDWVQRFLCGDPPYEMGSKCFLNPVDISPNLFRVFGIEQVPAVVYVPDPEQLATCGLNPLPDKDYYVWYGDLAPSYVLEQFLPLRPEDGILTGIARQVGR